MMNRGWSVCLLLAGLVAMPGAVSAQEEEEYEVTVTIGEVMPVGEHAGCPDYLSSGRYDEPWSGWLEEEVERTETTTETSGFTFGGGYNGISAGFEDSRRTTTSETYPVGYYRSTNNQRRRIDCRTLTELKT